MSRSEQSKEHYAPVALAAAAALKAVVAVASAVVVGVVVVCNSIRKGRRAKVYSLYRAGAQSFIHSFSIYVFIYIYIFTYLYVRE